MTTPLSKQQQVNEIIKCGKDPVYFMKKYAKIQHPKRGLLPFETYPFQDECIASFEKLRFNIILKSRQLGLSTVTAAYATWYAIFKKDKNVLVIATKLTTAMNFIKKVRVILDNLPKWLLLTKFEPSKQSISFSNGSQITAVPTSPDAGRSEALSLLIVDEAAHIRDFEEIWTGLYPTLSEGGNAIIISTPNGVGGQYYKLWTEGENGPGAMLDEDGNPIPGEDVSDDARFNCIRLPWHAHPEHDKAWFDKETRNLSKRKVAQEYLCVGGNTKIITPDGYKLAEELVVGDLVLTHRGRFQPVTRIGSRQVDSHEKIYEVSSPGSRKCKFNITGNHPMLSYRFWANNKSSLDVVSARQLEPSWIAAEDIAKHRKTTDRIVNVLFPTLSHEIKQTLSSIDMSTLHTSTCVTDDDCRYHKQHGKTKRHVTVNFDLGKFIGLYLAEGCNNRGGVDLGFHSDELNTHARWCVSFLENLGCRTTLLKSKQHDSCRLWTFNKHVSALVNSFISSTKLENGRHAPTKLLNMDRVLACGPEFIKGLLFGHYLGDGTHGHAKKTCVYSTSSKLIYQLRTLNSMFDLYPRIGHSEHNKKNTRHSDMWYLEFQTDGVSYRDLLDVGQQYKKGSRTRLVNGSFVGHHNLNDVTNTCKLDGVYTVYDISVANDRSFIAQSAVVHNCDFISSGDTFLQPEDLDYLRDTIESPVRKEGPSQCVWVWDDPSPNRKYVISSDVSRGDSADYSTFHVIDYDSCEIVAEYMGKIPPDKLADLLAEYGKKYNNAVVCAEKNTFGYFTNVRLRDLSYPRLYYPGMSGNIFEKVDHNPDVVPGFDTQTKSRQQILAKLEELIRNRTLKTSSQRLYNQLQAFIWNGSRAQASKDSHDDLVISAAIGSWLTSGMSSGDTGAEAVAMAMLKATSMTRRDSSQMPGDIESAKPLVNPNIRGFNPHNVSKPRDPSQVKNADISDFSWLLK